MELRDSSRIACAAIGLLFLSSAAASAHETAPTTPSIEPSPQKTVSASATVDASDMTLRETEEKPDGLSDEETAGDVVDILQDVDDVVSEEPEPEDISSFEFFRSQVGGTVRAAAGEIDDFFADEEHEAEENDSSLRLRFDADFDEDEGFTFEANPTLRLRLPGIRRTLLLEARALGDTGDSEDGAETPGEQFALDDDENDFDLELNLRLLEEFGDLSVSPEIGLRFDGVEPQPFGGGRVRLLVAPEESDWTFLVSERLRLFSDRGLESLTRAQADRLLMEDLLLRIDGEVLWQSFETGFRYGPGASLFYKLDERAGMAFQTRAVFETDPTSRLDAVSASIRYRRRVFTDYTTIEVTPRVTAEEDDDLSPTYGILTRFEIEF